LSLKAGIYAGTRALERSVAWIDFGKDRHPPGGELWLGGIGRADPDQMLYFQPVRAIQPEVPAKDALGQDEGGGFL